MKRNFYIHYSGSLTIITARTKKAVKWINKNVHYEIWQAAGPSLYVDSRMADDIIEAIETEF